MIESNKRIKIDASIQVHIGLKCEAQKREVSDLSVSFPQKKEGRKSDFRSKRHGRINTQHNAVN